MASVAERRALAEVELLALAGAESLCTLSRAGGSVDAAKYAEGRLAALAEVERLARRSNDEAAAARSVLDAWDAHLRTVRERALGDTWLAYRAGGVDEMAALLAELTP